MIRHIITFLLLSVVFMSVVQATEAAFLKFDNTSYTVTSGDTILIQVMVDPGSDQIAGTDAYVTFDSTLLQATTVTAGTYFPSVSNDIAAGKVSIWGVTEPASPKTGVGTIATITFKALKSGTGTLTYFCDAASSSSSKVVKNDINATNVITCSQNQTATISSSGTSSSGGTTASATPSQLPQTGSFDNLPLFGIFGVSLLAAGFFLKVLFAFI